MFDNVDGVRSDGSACDTVASSSLGKMSPYPPVLSRILRSLAPQSCNVAFSVVNLPFEAGDSVCRATSYPLCLLPIQELEFLESLLWYTLRYSTTQIV